MDLRLRNELVSIALPSSVNRSSPFRSAVAIAHLAAEDPVHTDRVSGDDRQHHDASVEQKSQ